MDLFKIEPGLFIWTWITFGTLLLLLYKLVYPSLLKGIKDREQKIADSIDKAEEIERRLAAMKNEHQEMLNTARKEADVILRKVREDAGKLKKELAAKAEKEAGEILEEARRKIEAEREAVINSLKEDLADFVCDAAGKLAGRALTGTKEKEWAEELVNKL